MMDYRKLARFIILPIVTALVLLLTVYKADQNSQRRARYQERRIRQDAAGLLAEEAKDRVRMAVEAQMSYDAFQKAFGPVVALPVEATGKQWNISTHLFTHAASQRNFYLRFEDDKLLGMSSTYSLCDTDAGVVRETPSFLRTEMVRLCLLWLSMAGWWIVLLIEVFGLRFSGHIPTTLTVLSMVCGLCCLLAPNYTPTMHGVLRNDLLGFSCLMLFASLLSVWPSCHSACGILTAKEDT